MKLFYFQYLVWKPHASHKACNLERYDPGSDIKEISVELKFLKHTRSYPKDCKLSKAHETSTLNTKIIIVLLQCLAMFKCKTLCRNTKYSLCSPLAKGYVHTCICTMTKLTASVQLKPIMIYRKLLYSMYS